MKKTISFSKITGKKTNYRSKTLEEIENRVIIRMKIFRWYYADYNYIITKKQVEQLNSVKQQVNDQLKKEHPGTNYKFKIILE